MNSDRGNFLDPLPLLRRIVETGHLDDTLLRECEVYIARRDATTGQTLTPSPAPMDVTPSAANEAEDILRDIASSKILTLPLLAHANALLSRNGMRQTHDLPTLLGHARWQRNELSGVINDIEHGNPFDATCLDTLKRIRDFLDMLPVPAINPAPDAQR